MRLVNLISALLALMFISSCDSERVLKEKADHQAKTEERINKAQENAEPLFNEMEQ